MKSKERIVGKKANQEIAAGIGVLAAVTGLAVCILLWGEADQRSVASASVAALRRPSGSAQLVSRQTLPVIEGQQCEWVPASSSLRLSSLLQEQSFAAGSQQPARIADLSSRRPVRMIRDPHAAFSAVAVDHKNNEVVLTDENLFQVLVYDRLANTPPTATMTEPKRILGGDKTEIEFQCGVYIDPNSGDIYAVNNDTVDKLVIFSREAKGNVPPDRELHTPHGTFGIAVDEEKEQMLLTIQHDNAVVTYRKYAQKDDPPIRLLQGDRTQLADPHGIALDTKNNLIYVTNYGTTHSKEQDPESQGSSRYNPESSVPNWPLASVVPGSGKFHPPSITVYKADASGNTPPVRVIQGPKARLNWATGIAIDSQRGELYVANDMADEVLVFDSSAQGDVAPKRVLSGPKSMVKNPTGVYLDLKNDELWVTNFGNHTATVYKRTAEGNTPPLRVIRSGPVEAPAPMMGNPHPVAYDSKRDEILVPN